MTAEEEEACCAYCNPVGYFFSPGPLCGPHQKAYAIYEQMAGGRMSLVECVEKIQGEAPEICGPDVGLRRQK